MLDTIDQLVFYVQGASCQMCHLVILIKVHIEILFCQMFYNVCVARFISYLVLA